MAGRKGEEFHEHVRSPDARDAQGRQLRSVEACGIPASWPRVLADRRRSHA